jgi:hypothetical protein
MKRNSAVESFFSLRSKDFLYEGIHVNIAPHYKLRKIGNYKLDKLSASMKKSNIYIHVRLLWAISDACIQLCKVSPYLSH